MTEYRLSFVVKTKEKPKRMFRKIWDVLKEFDEDVFGFYQYILSFKEKTRILEGVKELGNWDEITTEVLNKMIEETKAENGEGSRKKR